MAVSTHLLRRLAVVSRFVPAVNATPLRYFSSSCSVSQFHFSRLPTLVTSTQLIVKKSTFEPRVSLLFLSGEKAVLMSV